MNCSLALAAGKAKKDRDTGLKPLQIFKSKLCVTFADKTCFRSQVASKSQLCCPWEGTHLLRRYFRL